MKKKNQFACYYYFIYHIQKIFKIKNNLPIIFPALINRVIIM